MLLLLPFVPESPSWLISKGGDEAAAKVSNAAMQVEMHMRVQMELCMQLAACGFLTWQASMAVGHGQIGLHPLHILFVGGSCMHCITSARGTPARMVQWVARTVHLRCTCAGFATPACC